MTRYPRRRFLSQAGTIPFALWSGPRVDWPSVFRETNANRIGPLLDVVLTRPNASSAAGKAMLQKYAAAVQIMKDLTKTPEGSPTSWMFQWYTHAVRPDRTKASEMKRVYPSPGSAGDLAQQMWDTCEPHHAGGVEDFFLPWHRMYVYFFEQIIRKLSGDPAFVLPYWNYSVTGSSHGVIPPEFTVAGSALFQGNRNPGVNSGTAIDHNAPGALDLSALGQGNYYPTGGDAGFCADLDGGLHGNVHGLTGNVMNMGSVPWAANDAVFWMHHCNIDRLWASWNKNGGKNPTDAAWTGQSFVFADANGNRIQLTNGEVTDIAKLGYTYQEFEPAPAAFVLPEPAAAPPANLVALLAAPTVLRVREVALGAGISRNTLQSSAAGQAAPALTERIQALPLRGRMFLVLRGLRAMQSPNTLYGVYLNLPDTAGVDRTPFRVGYVNFFEAAAHAQQGAGSSAVSRSFDVTSLLRRQSANGAVGATPTVALIPTDAPQDGAQAVVGEISLIEQ